MGLGAGLHRYGEENNLFLPPEFKSRTVQPAVCRCTEFAIQAPDYLTRSQNCEKKTRLSVHLSTHMEQSASTGRIFMKAENF